MIVIGDPRLHNDFWAKVTHDASTNCWEWQAFRMPRGYGTIKWRQKQYLAHRLAYEKLVGNVPDGLELDHLCRNTSCVNPAHLEPVTHAENVKRGRGGAHNAVKTHCPSGHPYSGENLRISTNQRGGIHRTCKQCHDDWVERNRGKLNAKARDYQRAKKGTR